KAASSRVLCSPVRSPRKELRSAWMAKARGGTMCSSNVCGEVSNMKKCICGPTRAFPMPANQSDVISTSTTPDVHIRALTALRPIRRTSSCRSARRHNPGRGSTYRRGNAAQRFGASADYFLQDPPFSFYIYNDLDFGDLVCFVVLSLLSIQCIFSEPL